MLGLADGGDWEHERRLLALLRPEDRRALRRSFARMLGGGPAVRLHAALAGAAGGSGGIQVEAQQVRSLAGGAFEVSGVVRHASDASRADSARHRAMRFDAVTGLPNRTWLVERMAALPDRPAAAVAILGIERFAGLADALGPQASDGLAAEIAVRLRRLAASGRPGEASIDAIAQLERDVWCLLLAGPVDRVAATDAVQQALAAMREPFRIAGRELFLRASAGVDLHAQDGDEPRRPVRTASRSSATCTTRSRAARWRCGTSPRWTPAPVASSVSRR
jgi:GGDEF domain-containing protein